MSHDSAMKQITGYHARALGYIPAHAIQGFSLAHSNSNIPTQPQTNMINEPQCSHGIVYPIHKQLTVCNNDHFITITNSTHNSTGELLHPNIIMVALPVCLNQIVTGSLSTMGENA